MDDLTHGSLFTGIAGIDYAFELAGISTEWMVEIDPHCQSVLRHRHPTAPLHSDVRDVGAHNLKLVDIISFGSPCQDMSIAGNRQGLAGARSGLFYEALRIVGELRPSLALWENVPGALSSHAGRDFRAILAAFSELGARDISWRVLDAQNFGVPQRRRRIFLVADFRGERAGDILFKPEGVRWHFTPRRSAGESPAAHAAGGPRVGYPGYSDSVAADMSERDVLAFTCKDDGRDVGAVAPTLRSMNYDQSHLNGGGQVAIAFTERTRNGEAQVEWQEDLAYALTNPGAGGRADDRMIAYCALQGQGAQAVTHTLSVEGADASEDGTGTPIVVIQDASMPRAKKENGIDIKVGGPMYTLDAHGAHGVALATEAHPPSITYGISNQSSPDFGEDIMPPFTAKERGGGRAEAVAYTVNLRGREGGATAELGGEQSTALRANQGGGDKPHVLILPQYRVRRLTPIECLRLQGLPDDWLDAEHKGKPLSNSAKYRMVGNSVAVPCLLWLAQRILDCWVESEIEEAVS